MMMHMMMVMTMTMMLEVGCESLVDKKETGSITLSLPPRSMLHCRSYPNITIMMMMRRRRRKIMMMVIVISFLFTISNSVCVPFEEKKRHLFVMFTSINISFVCVLAETTLHCYCPKRILAPLRLCFQCEDGNMSTFQP